MSEFFTHVEIAFYPEFVNHWLRFGAPDREFDLDRRRAIAFFKPGRTFGYVRWIANEYGTQVWLFTVVQSVPPTERLSRIRGVRPGGDILLQASGRTKVNRVLAQFDELEKAGFDPACVSAAHYRHLHNRIDVGLSVCAYSSVQHQAYLAARRVFR